DRVPRGARCLTTYASLQERSLRFDWNGDFESPASTLSEWCSFTESWPRTYHDVPLLSLRPVLPDEIRHATCPSPCGLPDLALVISRSSKLRAPSALTMPPALGCHLGPA